MPNNTLLRYRYVDGSNYKTFGQVVLAGELTATAEETIRAGLSTDADDGFLPAQVGLPTLQEENPTYYDDDHVWHELVSLTPTHARADVGMTVEEFAAQFINITWDLTSAAEQLEGFKASRPRGH